MRIGMLGGGWIIEKAHLPAFQRIPEVEVAAICDVDLERVKVLQDRFAIPTGTDQLEGFLQTDLDAVVIATPNYTHASLTKLALQSGKHVLCEKPFALSYAEALSMQELAEERKLVLMPAFVNRFRPDISLMREKVQAGEIGTVRQVEASWTRQAGIPRPGSWFTQKKYAGGGVLLDLGSHLLDIALDFLGDGQVQEILSITRSELIEEAGYGANWYAQQRQQSDIQADVEDTAYAVIRLDQGKLLTLQASWAGPVPGDATYFKLIGTGGMMELKTLFGFSTNRLWAEDQLTVYNHRTNQQTTHQLNTESNYAEQAFQNMARHFSDLIQHKVVPLVKVQAGVKTAEILEKIYQNNTGIEIGSRVGGGVL